MQLNHKWEDCPEHVEILLKPEETMNANYELQWLVPMLSDKPEETGSASDNATGEILKDNGGIWLGQVYTERSLPFSSCFSLVKNILTVLREGKYTPHSSLNYMHVVEMYNLLFNAYKNNHYYKGHRDMSKVTLLLWLGEHNFTGGDILFNDFNYKIDFAPNKAILFPSHYNHEVTKIQTSSNEYVRYCVTAFIV